MWELELHVKNFAGKGKITGVYVPLRALSYFGVLNLHREVRLFDDDRGLHGRWLDGYGSASRVIPRLGEKIRKWIC